MSAPRQCRAPVRGFTLIEMAIVIALIGVVAAMVGVFVTRPVTAYVDQARRAALSDTADTALRRVARELGRALPNSVRVDPSGLLLEFLPVSAGGRYRAAPAADGSGDYLDLDDPLHASFDVLGPPVTAAAGAQLVIYNLGLPGADAYSGESRRPLASSGAGLSNLAYAVGSGQFPFPSPGNRFQIIGAPVTYACTPGAGGTGTLRRYTGYPIQASQPVDPSAAPLGTLAGTDAALLADKVASCSFAYSMGPSARIGIVTMRLQLASGGEQLTLVDQAHVDNSP